MRWGKLRLHPTSPSPSLTRRVPSLSPQWAERAVVLRGIDRDGRPRGTVGDRHRARSACPGSLESETVLWGGNRIRRRSQHSSLAGRRGFSGHAAGDQPVLRRAGGQDRARSRRRDKARKRFRPEELLLRRPAARLSDFAIPATGRRPWQGRARHAGRDDARDRHYPAASRAGRRQEPARPAPEHSRMSTSTGPVSH